MNTMTPREIVSELDKHIIGQDSAKRSVAIALRNRWRRQQVPQPLRQEITPKNILMIGPTGVGKTEIARRLARLSRAPFIKVEATKFTEVGYVGRDVDSIIRDLMEAGFKQVRDDERKKVGQRALDAAEDRVLDALLPGTSQSDNDESATRQKFRKKLREGDLDDKEIEIEVSDSGPNLQFMGPNGMEEITQQLQGMFSNLPGRRKTQRLPIRDAMKVLADEEAGKMVNDDEIKALAVDIVEQSGIVFIDEIDKVAVRNSGQGSDVSRQGVQRDLLPLIEGTTVNTKYGPVSTDHILFIASGAFHLSKPSDLVPELQGRLPIRVELSSLTAEDFVQILSGTEASLVKQHKALMHTDGVEIDFTDDAIQRIAEFACQVNESVENIGARRLHTVMERLFEEVSFNAPSASSSKLVIDRNYVESRLADTVKNQDLSQYVL